MSGQHNTESFEKDVSSFGIDLSEYQIDQFIRYYDILVEWNSFMNLTAITKYDDVFKKHFLDSISLVKAIPRIGQMKYSVIDVGTGAGFPGIPLKIVFPELKITLLDSLNKRVQFLNKVIDLLTLKDIVAIHGRAEDVARQKDKRETFDLCVSRAVANLSTLTEYCIPFVKKDGFFISYKSEKVKEECDKAKSAIKILGGKYDRQVEFYLPDSNIYRNLVMIKKEKSTPAKFPRKAGVPSKEPID